MKRAKYIILHCSGTDVMAFNDINIIKQWHQARGWRTVGYHFFVTANGEVQSGRKLDEDMIIEKDEVGAHALGFNDESIGICMHGNQFFIPQQFRAQAKLIEDLKKQFGLTNDAVIGHNEIPSAKKQGKTCPNYDVKRFKDHYLIADAKTKRDDTKGDHRFDQGRKPAAEGNTKAAAAKSKSGTKGADKK